MEDICIQLDQLTVEFFDNLERLQEKREYLNAAVRDGHLNLSKARYSMGNKSVGALQYSHRMDCALFHIEGAYSKDQSEDNCMTLEMKKTLPGKVIEASKADFEGKDDERNVLRRRKPQKSNSVNDEITGIEELSLSKEDKLPVDSSSNGCVQDPLKWFGILVPGCLRTGQKNFQSAIELSCEMVNLEFKLKEMIERFKALKARKRELILEESKRSQDVED
ncbi:vacuolar ATPase assembly protein VMA22-like [Oculina patagonica]